MSQMCAGRLFHNVEAAAEIDLAPKVASMCPLRCSKTTEERNLYFLSYQMFTGPWGGSDGEFILLKKNIPVVPATHVAYSTGLLLGCCGFDGVRTNPQGFLKCVFNYMYIWDIGPRYMTLNGALFCLNWLTVRCCHWWCRWCRQWPQCHKRRRVSQLSGLTEMCQLLI